MKNILVTGCAGFIGSHLCECLLKLNYQVVGIDNFDPFYNIDIKKKNLAAFSVHPNFQFIEVDLAEKSKLENEFPEGIDLVVHLAGKAGVRPSIEDPASYIRANVVATQNILDAKYRLL